jgi:polysaccharide pyruvyl transferase WcaK-like protein
MGTLAAFANWLLERGYSVVLFASQVRLDFPVLLDLQELVRQKAGSDVADRLFLSHIQTVADLLSLVSKLHLIVASRLHGLLLSQLMYTPSLAVSYESKIDSLMESLGLSEYCLNIDTVEEKTLIERFTSLENSREAIRNRLRQRVADYRAELQAQYEIVFRS